MAKLRHSRRVFLRRMTFMGGGVVLLGGPACSRNEGTDADRLPKKNPARPPLAPLTTSHLSFTNEEFAALSAACERILPRDQDPGAVELGVPQYIDRALQTAELRKMKDEFQAGLGALMRRAERTGKKPFEQLGAPEQDALLASFKDSAQGTGEEHFYELLLTLTMEGALGDPSYGGNKDRAGWALVGFTTSAPGPGYDGVKHLHDPSRGLGGGGSGGCH